jgi:uncharacterized repeat protein (TIGR02543 family)
MGDLCNICGGNLNGRGRCTCCGAYRQEDISGEETTLLYTAGQNLRMGRFAEAEEQYVDIVKKYPKCLEAHWGLVLSRYNIKFEEDDRGKKLPTCYAATMHSFIDDKDFKTVLELAGSDASNYKQQAFVIEGYCREWAEKTSMEPDYDVFLSYKDSDKENDIRTEDSYDVAELYDYLKDKGYRVFYSRISLKDKTGEKYEPYIYHALRTASAMIVYGSKPEYFESTWIKNEWTRYLKLMREGEKADASLIVVYKGMNPAELPPVLRSLQALNANSIDFLENLVKGIEKIKACPTEKGKGDSFSPQKPSQEVEVARKKIIDTAERVYIESGYRNCSDKASQLEALLQYSMLQIAVSDRDFDKKEAELIAGITLKDDLFRHLKDTNIGIDSWAELYRVSEEKRQSFLANLSDGMKQIVYEFVGAVEKMPNADEADRYLRDMKQSWDTVLDAVISADGVRSYQEMGNGCLIAVMFDVAQGIIYKKKRRMQKKADRKPLSAGTKKFIRVMVAFLIAAAAIGAVSVWGVSYCRKTSLSYREISGGYEVYCSSEYEGISSLTIPSTHDGQSVIAVASSGFKDRTEIKSVVLPDTIQSIGKDAFSGCTNLESIAFPDGLKKIGDGAFAGTAIGEVELSATISSFGIGVFSDCTQLTTVVLQEGIEAIAESTFSGSAVKFVTLPSTIRTIGKNAFSGCTQMKSITLPLGLETIADGAFGGSGLETLLLPETVKTVGDDALGNCAKLGTIKIVQDNSIPSTWAKAWNGNTDASIGFVYCCTLDCTSTDDMDSSTVYFDPTNLPAFPVPTRQGYSFLGWLDGETLVSDSAGNPLSMEIISCSCTLTPNWEPLENRITFNANGGTGTMEGQTILSDHSDALSGNKYTKDGYHFLGWSTSKGTDSATYSDGATYRMGTGSVTLYAVWEANENYVSFDANGGVGTMGRQMILTDHSADLLPNQFSKDGYYFLGWSATKNASKATYGNGGVYKMGTESVTLYAVWEPNKNTVTFNANGGSGAMREQTILSDHSASLLSNQFTKGGYRFAGWALSQSSDRVVYTNGAVFNMGHQSVTLYAVWKPIENTITFNANGGKGTMGKLAILSDQSGKLLTNQFAREGYSFLGWSSDKNASKAAYVDGATYRMGTESVTLYAVWEAYENRITFNANGGKGSMESQIILSDHSAELIPNKFTRDGYSFVGWASAKDAGAATYADRGSYTIGTKSVTLYAVWIKSSEAVTLRSNSEKNSVVITDQEAYTDTVKPGFNVKDLTANGFTQVLITILFDCREIDDGYQDVEICTAGGKSLASETVEHGSGLLPTTTWGMEECSFTFSLSDLASDGSFVIKWGAHGMLDDDWKLGHTEITVEAQKK